MFSEMHLMSEQSDQLVTEMVEKVEIFLNTFGNSFHHFMYGLASSDNQS